MKIRRTRTIRLAAPSLACAATCALTSWSTPASAQTVGWNVDRFDPTPAGDVFFASPSPVYSGRRPFRLSAALLGDYAHRPLVYSDSRDPTGTRAIIEHMLVLHAQVSVAFVDRLSFDVSVPTTLVESGPSIAAVPVAASNHASVGDIRIGARARIFGHAERDPFSVHVGLSGYLGSIGYNSPSDNVTDGGFRARGYVALAGRAGPIRWSLAGGYHARPSVAVLDVSAGSELFASAAIAVVAFNDRFTVGPEFFASTTASRAFQPRSMNAEALLGVHYQIGMGFSASAGAGPGITQGEGTPQFRALLRLAYSPDDRSDAAREVPRDERASGAAEGTGSHRAQGAVSGPPGRHAADSTGQGAAGSEGTFCPDHTSDCLTRDTDHDGVLDVVDECVSVPAGPDADPARAGCPDGDRDADGAVDHLDLCPAVAQGATPDPQRRGCPLVDRDGDRVGDEVDHCPDQPGAPSPDPTRNGCPGLVRLEAGTINIVEPVFFATSRARVLSRSIPVLAAVADTLRARADVLRVSVDGHTDNAGNGEINVDLSMRRATAVMLWLVEHGIDPTRLEAHGYGDTRPIAPNTSRAGRSANRRVEFRVLGPTTTPVGAASGSPSAAPRTSGAPQ